jgi:hypothetical protein
MLAASSWPYHSAPTLNSSSLAKKSIVDYPSAPEPSTTSPEAKSITPDKEHDVNMKEEMDVEEELGGIKEEKKEGGPVVMEDATPKAGNGNSNGDDGKAKENGSDAAVEDTDTTTPILILKGTLSYSSDPSLRQHQIRGNWTFKNNPLSPPERFELLRTIPPEEDLKQLPMGGEFHGTYSFTYAFTNSKGKTKMKRKNINESGVKINFTKTDQDGVYDVKGGGENIYGTFDLWGTASKSTLEDDPGYRIKLNKIYTTTVKDAPAKKEEVDQPPPEKPAPTQLPKENVVCLCGKLTRNTSENLSLGLGDVVHKISGVWAMGYNFILNDPTNSNGLLQKFEYEHKCSGDSTVFPLSGKYTGWFYVDAGAGNTTKISERDIMLKFIENSEGYHNVEGKGSNIYGKYSISGTLEKDGAIKLFRHFQVAKLKVSNKKAKAPIGSTLISTPAPGHLSDKKGGLAAIPPLDELPMSFDDVKAPDGSEPIPVMSPPLVYGAVSKGIFKINDDGHHTCSGNWAITFDQLNSGAHTSSYHFGLLPHTASDDAKDMLNRMESSGASKHDDRKKPTPEGSVNEVIFPIDSARYRGSFKMKKGGMKLTTVKDQQIILKFVKNTSGSYNVYGKGVNEMGTFDIVGTLIQQTETSGHLILYRVYPPPLETEVVTHVASKSSGKVFPGSLTEKAVAGRPPAMKPPERFTPSASSLQRRESGRQVKVPTRLEDDDPESQRASLMEKCRGILKDLQAKDVNSIFAIPVDPVALQIPTYFDIIKEPMDLGTIQTQIETGELESPEEFIRLVRLVFENAITFNSMPDSLVHTCARSLLGMFNTKIRSVERVLDGKNKKLSKAELAEVKRKEKEAAKDRKKGKRKGMEEGGNESKRKKLSDYTNETKSLKEAITQAAPTSPDAPVSRQEFNLLMELIQLQSDHIAAVHRYATKSGSSLLGTVDSKNTSSADATVHHAEGSSKSTTSPKKKKPKTEKNDKVKTKPPPSPQYSPEQPSEENLEPLSMEEQVALSEGINGLPEYLLPGAMQIIREADSVNDDDDEIDLDLDMLDIRTQRKLQRYINENVKPNKRKKEKKRKSSASVAATAPARSPLPAPSPESEEPAGQVEPRPSGKTFFSLGHDDSDSESEAGELKDSSEAQTAPAPAADPFADDEDGEDDEEEDLKVDLGANWLGNPSQAEVKAGEEGDDSDKDDDEDDLWGAAKKEAEASKALEADRAKREEKLIAEANKATQKRMEEAQALGEEVRAKREEEAANEARRLEEQKQEEENAKKEAREKQQQELDEMKPTIDLDAQRLLMQQYEQEFNDNYSAGASPSSDFGF